ncbi:phage tail sheath subtilisin-like domain-containing protein [Brevundimonas sp.]|uniref:phage tail sheath subtilisin-like domain-containing protein n=1 Tax=Brevundimonas sp. TaxID=1871086 RepID=UPI00289E3064|nr:phage tail sheath subtilisin-like domain-containing protein [Brevundimonas sp.]
MALAPRRHGVKIIEVTTGALTLQVAATAIWGLVATASAADADVFPLDKPVIVTDIGAAIEAAGADGTLAKALRAIGDQVNAIGVVVRVAEGEGGNEEDIATSLRANIIGDGAAGSRTGMQALLDSQSITGLRPRILAVPGVTDQAVGEALGMLASRLNAVAYYEAGPVRTVTAASAFRANFTHRELFLIFGSFTAADPFTKVIQPTYATAVAVGLRARIDQGIGFHKTISNVPVNGVIGLDTPVSWDLQDENTEAGLLNGADITCLIRRDGYRFWGNRGCSSDARFAFESTVRTNQVLRDTIAEGVFPYIDRPLTPALARDIVESINALFRRLKSAGQIIGAEAFLTDANTPDQLAGGKLRIGYRFTPCAPLEDLSVESQITDEFYADFNTLAA